MSAPRTGSFRNRLFAALLAASLIPLLLCSALLLQIFRLRMEDRAQGEADGYLDSVGQTLDQACRSFSSAAAALEVEGVSSLAANLGSDIAELLGKKNLAKGVRVKMEDDKVVVELSVLMSYGHTIPEMCKAVQEGVKNAIESMTGLEVSAVNVNVGGVTFPPKKA